MASTEASPSSGQIPRAAPAPHGASVRSRLLLAMVALLIVLTGGILLGLELVAHGEVPARLASALDSSRQALQERLSLDLVGLTSEANVTAEEPRIKAVLNTPDVDSDTLGDVAAETRASGGWDLFGLATADGSLERVAGVDERRAPQQLEVALGGSVAVGYWATGASVYRVVALPVTLEDKQIGAVIAGDKLDDAYAERIGHSAQMQVALFAGDKLTASSLRGKARADVARFGERAIPPQLTLNGEAFLARELPLGRNVRAAVLVSEEFMLRPLAHIRRTIVAVSAVALVMALLLSLALARSLSRPVGELVGLASAVRRHDLEARIVPSGGRELAVLGQTMNEMVVELAQQRRRDELAGFLVHDLKSPLAAVLGNAEFLLDSRAAPADDVREATRDIVEAAETMLRMVVDLLDVGKSADGQLVPRKTPFEIASFMEDIRQRAAARAALRKQTVAVDPGESLRLSADRELLRRVIDNLLDNCFKYTPAGGTITIGWRVEIAGEVVIRVRDEGPGVPAELRERIFDKYFQLDRDVAQHSRTSRGMGLVFCKAAVEAHGGKIWVEDNQPKGSAFGIRLPPTA